MNEQRAYLETQVMTASPPKLRLMMIDAALQLARRSLRVMEVGQAESAFRNFEPLRRIILQLLTSLEGRDGGLGQNIQQVYMYLYREVIEAQLSGDKQAMSDVVRVLEVERETWQELAQRFVTESAARNARHSERTDPAAVTGSAHSIGSTLCLEG